MAKSLLFIPDLSGFTNFVNTTEVEHSNHVIAELLEILLDSNILGMELAEIEGDALFFYIENELPDKVALFGQVEEMFTAFYNHLKLFEHYRICPCNACASAPELKLKIIVHCGELQFINIKDIRKPFGKEVIKVHRLLKNSVPLDDYILLSEDLTKSYRMQKQNYLHYNFIEKRDNYDFGGITYSYAAINLNELNLNGSSIQIAVDLPNEPDYIIEREFSIPAKVLFEYITNYKYRHHWIKGADSIEYNSNEVTRSGTPHICVINQKHLNFKALTKPGLPGQLIYGELTTDPPPLDEYYQFYIVSPISKNLCHLKVEMYLKYDSLFKKIIMNTIGKRSLFKKIEKVISDLEIFVSSQELSVDQ